MSDEAEKKSEGSREDWSVPLPAEIPRPTYAPAAMAFGLTFFLWGFVTSPVVLAAGLIVTVAALVSWIGEMRHGE
jgi:hypothetical protein